MLERTTRLRPIKNTGYGQRRHMVTDSSSRVRACLSSVAGFTLIEMVVTTVIIALLALMAIPNIVPYRNKSRVAIVLNEAIQIQSALANYALDSDGSFPLAIGSWQALNDIVKVYSSPLPAAPAELYVQSIVYVSVDGRTYTLHISVNVPNSMAGRTFVITPTAVTKQ